MKTQILITKKNGLMHNPCFAFLKIAMIFVLFVMGLNVSAQQWKTETQILQEIAAAKPNDIINFATSESGINHRWFFVKKDSINNVRYAFLISVKFVDMGTAHQFSNNNNNQYDNSLLRTSMRAEFPYLPPVLQNISVAPILGDNGINAKSTPTATKGTAASDALFAPSYRELYEWNNNAERPLKYPLSTYLYGQNQRFWTRTASTVSTANAYEVNVGAGTITSGTHVASSIGMVGGIWVRYGSGNQYSLTYYGNGNTGGSAPNGGSYPGGTMVNLANPGTLTKTDHTFLGWALSASATTPQYAYTGGIFTPPSFSIMGNTNLYAVWRDDTNPGGGDPGDPNADCVGAPQAVPWSIQLRSKTRLPGDGSELGHFINVMDVPLVGDIYGNGKIKILAAVVVKDSLLNKINWTSDHIAIFDGKTGAWEKTIKTCRFHTGTGTRAIAKIGGITRLYVAQAYYNGKICCYNLETGAKIWETEETYVPSTTDIGKVTATILLADINADGKPEIIAGYKIFNAETGKLLLDMSATSYGYGAGHLNRQDQFYKFVPYFPAVADMNKDGHLEFIGGHRIYKPTIPANANSISGSSSTLLRYVTAASGGNTTNSGDGATVVADLDGDGFLDVIVTRNSGIVNDPPNSGTPYLFAWKGNTGEMFGNAVQITQSSTSDPATYAGYGPSIPVVGDVDGCGLPEIIVSTNNRIHVFKYKPSNPVANRLERIAYIVTKDPTGSTAVTLFDFNSDGILDIVYRDEDGLHVYNLQGNTLVSLPLNNANAKCFSGTQNEFPIVADVTGNGQANIVVFGSDDLNDAPLGKGYLYIYESAPEYRWAPARPVWNQWAYNAVNVNDDLTIPTTQFNPATSFSGGNCGTVRPYNAFLKQQTEIDEHGCPVVRLPNIEWVDEPELVMNGNSFTLSGNITNTGAADLFAPVYVTFYKNSVETGNIIKLDSINAIVHTGEVLYVSFTVNTSLHYDISKIIVGLNEKNGVHPYWQVCEIEERVELTYCPVVSITGETVICTGTTTTLFPTSGGTWTSSNPTVASVSNDGVVTGHEKGMVTFTFHNALSGCNQPAETESIKVISSLPVWVAISASDDNICYGTWVTFTAIPSYNGASTSFQWKKNGTGISGATGSTYTYMPVNEDIITCEISSTMSCASPSTAASNSITMRVSVPGVKPSISIMVE